MHIHHSLTPPPLLSTLLLLLLPIVSLLPLSRACVHYQAHYGCTASDLDFHASITDNGQLVCWANAGASTCGPDYCSEYAMACLAGVAAWVSAPDAATVHYHAHGDDFAWEAQVRYDDNPYGCDGGAWWDVWVFC